jgi:predicted alpha/beta-fold hydrolase
VPPVGLAPSFTPAWWLPGPHCQTVGARWTRRRDGPPLERERVSLPDGDFLDLDWARAGTHADPRRAVVVVLHGLEGSARSGYALETYRQLERHGLAAVGLNFRSCSGELNRGRRLYHSGETDDLRFVVGLLRRRFPEARIGAVGFSLGGNVLLKYLGEESPGRQMGQKGQEGQGVQAAAAISVPYDLAASAAFTERGVARLYVRRLVRSLRAKVRARQADLGALLDARRALRARTFWEFDDAATAPLHGFRDADDYYARSSSATFLRAIGVETLLIHAEDDPFLPPSVIPRDAVAANPRLRPLFVRHGGHVGFVAGQPWRRRYWAEARAADFLAARITPSDRGLQEP